MPHADVNGQKLWYTDTGGDGVPLLFSHGFMMSGEMFEPQIEHLRARYRCVTWDERGHGQTVEDGGPFTIWDLADDAVGLLDHLGIERAVLIGMSQGGFISLRAALAHRERVRALVLIDTEAGSETAENKVALEAMFGDWAVNGAKNYGRTAAGLLLADPALEDLWISKWEMIEPSRVTEPARAIINRDSVLDRLGEISCPTLIIHGTEDPSITLDRAELLADGLADVVAFARIDGGRHAPNLTHPEPVNAEISAFLAALPV